jgi:hypothetical protein
MTIPVCKLAAKIAAQMPLVPKSPDYDAGEDVEVTEMYGPGFKHATTKMLVEMMTPRADGTIRNPATGKYVSVNGTIGKKLVAGRLTVYGLYGQDWWFPPLPIEDRMRQCVHTLKVERCDDDNLFITCDGEDICAYTIGDEDAYVTGSGSDPVYVFCV